MPGHSKAVADCDASSHTELSRLRKQWQARAERGEIPQFGVNVTASIIFVLAVTFILLAGCSEPDLLPGLPAVAGQQ